VAEAPAPSARRLGYEPKDVSARWIVGVAVGGLLVLALSAAILYGLQRLYAALHVVSVEPPPTVLERLEPAPPPRLQAEPAQDFPTYRAREAAILDSYAWVDEDAGVARIPIERAMALLAERGWPQPATGLRPPPEVAEDLEPWPDWREAAPPSGIAEGDLAPEQGEAAQ
jgi:hypothetical protein